MIFIFGGAYQGKLAYVKETFQIKQEECYYCKDTVDFSFPVWVGLEQYILSLLEQNIDPLEQICSILPQCKDKIIIMQDISCGVVPIEEHIRKWREETGRIMVLLSKNADQTVRVYCGIGTPLNGE